MHLEIFINFFFSIAVKCSGCSTKATGTLSLYIEYIYMPKNFLSTDTGQNHQGNRGKAVKDCELSDWFSPAL